VSATLPVAMFELAKPVGTLGTAAPLPLLLLLPLLLVLLLLLPLLLLLLLLPLPVPLPGDTEPPQAATSNSSSIAARFREERVDQFNQCRSVKPCLIDPNSVLPNPHGIPNERAEISILPDGLSGDYIDITKD
jgi:hypothetical protein